MKLLINNIKRQIEQLDSRELKQWLLRHLNLNASQLTELFCKQYPTQKVPHTEARLINSPLFSLLSTYGSQALVDEFTSVFPEKSSFDIDSFQQGLLEQSISCLNDFRDVWPLISQIITKPKNLIELMHEASPKVLEAFKRLSVHSDWALLIEVFLIKDENKLEINRWKLINFLRYSSWIEELKIVKAEAKVLFTLCFHIHAFDTRESPENRLHKLMAFCQEYPFAPDRLDLIEFISFYSRLLAREDSLAINKEFIRLLDMLLKNLSRQEQKELIKNFDANNLDSLIAHCIEHHPLLAPIYQEAYKSVLFLLCRQAVDLGEVREIIQRQLNQIEKRSEDSQKEKDLFPLEQVILSPQFMATVTPLLIKKLMLRYSCFILTLNQDELIYFVTPAKELSPYYETFISHLFDIEKQLAQDPEQSNLLAQRERLLYWCIERSAHALLAELIRRCEQQNNKTALTSIYSYYSEHYLPLRADLRDATASHFYEIDRVSADPADLSTLENWRKDYLREEAQTQNPRNPGPYLYNIQGQCRAFIDESNKVWSLFG